MSGGIRMIKLPIKNSTEKYELNPSKIICVGRNYLEHVKEGKTIHGDEEVIEVPEEPMLFPKLSTTLIKEGEAIQLPLILEDYDFEGRTDYEGELAIIIGKKCKHVKEEDALSVVYGYTCLNDVSQRDIQNGDRSGWFRGKSFDSFGPVGPVVVLAEDMPDPQNLDIETRLNGKTVQKSNTRHMIFSLPVLIAYISRNFTLLPGDIISTGTPSGVGPLAPGDRVEVEVQNIGVLSNPVEEEKPAL